MEEIQNPQGQPQQQAGYQQPYQQSYQQPAPQQQLKISGAGEYLLKGIAKWMNIIAILSTIMIILVIIAAIYLLQIGYSAATGAGVAYLVVAAIYLYPTIQAFNVSKNFKLATDTTSDQALENGLGNLKSLVTFIGVLSIIGFILLIISVIVGITTYNQASSELNSLFEY